ncbi:hypothetical protein niasHT_011368 [Heterodera trifolii]|uniref:Histone-binding protein RBBP4-like N-terminal domain-containing protein n=1 Tax=Heterodera trifolii TaxID=157864 RepID=A0ABD2LI97_9BILA
MAELVYDEKAYLLFHTFEPNYPCLSFDVLSDSLGDNRSDFPMTAWLAAGTQADRAKDNQLLVLKLSNLHANEKTLENAKKMGQGKGDESESSSSEDEEEEETEGGAKSARMHVAVIPHHGGINRMKASGGTDRTGENDGGGGCHQTNGYHRRLKCFVRLCLPHKRGKGFERAMRCHGSYCDGTEFA